MAIRITDGAKKLIADKGYTVLTITQDFVGCGCTGGLPNIEIRPWEPDKGTLEQYDEHTVDGLKIYLKRNIEPKKDADLTLMVTGLIKKSLTLTGVKIDAL